MFKHILVPLDGSKLAEAALPAAVFFARCFDANISLIHIIERGGPETVHDQPHLHDKKEAEVYLAKTVSAFPQGTRADCHVHAEEVSRVAEGIVDHCMTELHSDLVIMCTHGDDGTRRFVSGSIAQQVIARGSVAVLAMHADGNTPREFTCGKILMPLGGQLDHGDIMDTAIQFAQCCGAAVRLVSVVPTFKTIHGKWSQVGRLLPGATSEMLDIEAEEMAGVLQLQASTLRAKGAFVETQILRGDPGRLIARDADQSDASIIVMATHGKLGMSALWAGSVAPKVFAASKNPILLLPVSRVK